MKHQVNSQSIDLGQAMAYTVIDQERYAAQWSEHAKQLKGLKRADQKDVVRSMLQAFHTMRETFALMLQENADAVSGRLGVKVESEKQLYEILKNRKDTGVKALRRVLKGEGLTLTIGKERDPSKVSITLVRETTTPNPANGKPSAAKNNAPAESQAINEVDTQPVSESDQAAAICAAFDSLPADLQDKVAAHIASQLEARPTPSGRKPRKGGNQLAQALRKAQESKPAATIAH